MIFLRYYPEDKYDTKELEELNAKPWQIELLKKNPSYNSWGNQEDYMSKEGTGWDTRVFASSVEEGLWELDDYNELVNFYFELYRNSVECKVCERSGLNPETKKLSDDWYSFDKTRWVYVNSNRRYNDLAWSNHLTEIEVEALVKAGRLRDLIDINCYYEEDEEKWYAWINGEKQIIDPPKMPTPEEVNIWNQSGMGHDSINQWIAVEARAKHLGVYGKCEHCGGKGHIYTEPEAKIGLQLWILHPRKGCSRGVYINEIKEHEVDKVIEHLRKAKDRNNDRFSRL
jgi:hypothetical protein